MDNEISTILFWTKQGTMVPSEPNSTGGSIIFVQILMIIIEQMNADAQKADTEYVILQEICMSWHSNLIVILPNNALVYYFNGTVHFTTVFQFEKLQSTPFKNTFST